jgi:hypothetical protein
MTMPESFLVIGTSIILQQILPDSSLCCKGLADNGEISEHDLAVSRKVSAPAYLAFPNLEYSAEPLVKLLVNSPSIWSGPRHVSTCLERTRNLASFSLHKTKVE